MNEQSQNRLVRMKVQSLWFFLDECVSTKLRVTENHTCFVLVILNYINIYSEQWNYVDCTLFFSLSLFKICTRWANTQWSSTKINMKRFEARRPPRIIMQLQPTLKILTNEDSSNNILIVKLKLQYLPLFYNNNYV